MKVSVNKRFFLEQALPIIDFDRITLAAYGGVLSVASFGNTVNFRVPAYVVETGQAFLSYDQRLSLTKSLISFTQQKTQHCTF
jgi:hypothetical protein